MPNKYVKRDERKEQIEGILRDMAVSGTKPELTAYGIAKKCDMRVSWVLYEVLADMVAEHRLTFRDENMIRCTSRRWYMLPKGSYPETTTRVIKINGKVWSTQEALF